MKQQQIKKKRTTGYMYRRKRSQWQDSVQVQDMRGVHYLQEKHQETLNVKKTYARKER